MLGLFKRLVHGLLGDYAIYQIWRLDAPQTPPRPTGLQLRPLRPEDLNAPGLAAELADSAWYFGDQAQGFGCFEGTQLLGLAFYWRGQRYAGRHSWPIEPQGRQVGPYRHRPAARGR